MSCRVLDLCRDLHVPTRRFVAGETILAQGKRAGVLVILREGEVEVAKQDVRITTVDQPGAIFGELSILLDRPHTATVRALDETECYIIESPDAFLSAHPEINIEIARLLAARLNGLTNYLVDLKRQFETRDDHLCIVDQVIENLIFVQRGPG